MKRFYQNLNLYVIQSLLHVTAMLYHGNILLADGIYWLSIYSIDHSKGFYDLRIAVHAGIKDVITNFRYMADPNYRVYFYCNICSNKCSEHFCIVNNDHKTVTCCDSRKTMSMTKSRQQVSFKVL